MFPKDIAFLIIQFKYYIMTRLGEFFMKKSINRSIVSRKTGLSRSRLTELSNNPSSKLRVKELYLISLALDLEPTVLLSFICEGITLPNSELETEDIDTGDKSLKSLSKKDEAVLIEELKAQEESQTSDSEKKVLVKG